MTLGEFITWRGCIYEVTMGFEKLKVVLDHRFLQIKELM
jgi:hypothetical protein